MIRLKNKGEISVIREASRILTDTLVRLEEMVEDGIATQDLDRFAREYIRAQGAEPAFLGYMNYPASLCISINEQVIHGIPGRRRLRTGDIVSLDLGVNLRGYFSDAAVTLPVGKVAANRRRLIQVTRECLARGIKAAVAGNRVSDISKAIFNHARENGMEVVRQYCGHGVGYSQHEEPQIPNYVSRGPNPRLKPGMVLALEPMISLGGWEVDLLEDQWTVVTSDRADSAHFEHTIAILKERTEVLTAYKSLERIPKA
jgi:methionyl aminopeptidase